MTLPYRQERLLRRAGRALRRSDPDLASMLAIFVRLTAADAMPARERLPPPRAPAWRVLLWPAAAVAFVIVFAAGAVLVGGAAAAAAIRRGWPRSAPSKTLTRGRG